MSDSEIAKKAIQLAKKTYEHFTASTLEIAKEIIALEKELNDSAIQPEKEKPSLLSQSGTSNEEDNPVREISPLEDHNAPIPEVATEEVFPVKKNAADDLPF